MITLEANYSKKLGLPGFSSHQFSVTLRTEISDVNQVQNESARLYKLLQTGVDSSIQTVGYLPGQNGNGNGNGNGTSHGNGHHSNGHANAQSDEWKCSAKQKDLILKIVTDNNLEKAEIEQLSSERFNKGVKLLNKLEASGLIAELLEKYGEQKQNGRGRFSGARYQKAGGR
jgi:hypothetical protein